MYRYINAQPQWRTIQRGNWRRMEENLRQRVEYTRRTLTIHAGTHGILELENQPIYLSSTIGPCKIIVQ